MSMKQVSIPQCLLISGSGIGVTQTSNVVVDITIDEKHMKDNLVDKNG